MPCENESWLSCDSNLDYLPYAISFAVWMATIDFELKIRSTDDFQILIFTQLTSKKIQPSARMFEKVVNY